MNNRQLEKWVKEKAEHLVTAVDTALDGLEKQVNDDLKRLGNRIGKLERPADVQPLRAHSKPNYALTRPLTQDALELMWVAMGQVQEEQEGKVCVNALSRRARELDAHGVWPHGYRSLHETIRAHIAEEAGLYIRWSRHTVLPAQPGQKAEKTRRKG